MIYSVSLVVIKYAQQSMYHIFQTLLYTDMLLSLFFYLLKYLNLFVWIYTDDVLYADQLWYAPYFNPVLIIPGMAYLLSMYLTSIMMFQSQTQQKDAKWTNSKVRITTLLCLKAFEAELLTFISLFISIKYLDVLDVFGMFIFIIAILIMI